MIDKGKTTQRLVTIVPLCCQQTTLKECGVLWPALGRDDRRRRTGLCLTLLEDSGRGGVPQHVLYLNSLGCVFRCLLLVNKQVTRRCYGEL